MPTPIAGWFTSRGVAATPGYFIAGTPFAGHKATEVATWTRSQDSSALAGGYANQTSIAVNAAVLFDHYLNGGTFKFALLYLKSTDAAITTVQLDGVSQGTIDTYAAALSYNNYTELTGLSVTAGLKVLKLLAATKNASSTQFYQYHQTYALVRTGA